MQFNGKIDQLAFISHGSIQTTAIKARLGLTDADWTEDIVYAEGTVDGKPGSNLARLLFNYDMGIEVEILEYLWGPNYAAVGGLKGGTICHYGIHANPGQDLPVFPGKVIQEVWTKSHTNPFLQENGRKYHYTIYDTHATLGVYTKVIERIDASHDSIVAESEGVSDPDALYDEMDRSIEEADL